VYLGLHLRNASERQAEINNGRKKQKYENADMSERKAET
jgi:hypothetical protein